MASWLSSTLGSFDTSKALNKISEISTKVKESLPPVNDELLGKLTLNSADLLAERTELDAQERRKENVRNFLSELLPWETKDEERDILVDECREAILALSKKQETFTLPIAPPEGVILFQKEESDDKKEESTPQDAEKIKAEAAARLEKVKPLPPLLDEFDLDAHVGLIERLFKADKDLVKIHSLLTGAGEKEKTFWKNYFINCAYARYEKGLEIDEIWGDKVETKTLESEHSNPTPLPLTDSPHAAGNTNDMTTSDDEVSIEMTFERENSLDNSISGSSMTGRANTETFIEQGSHTGSSNEYEIVDGVVGDLDDDDLDDLEAEIARELGED